MADILKMLVARAVNQKLRFSLNIKLIAEIGLFRKNQSCMHYLLLSFFVFFKYCTSLNNRTYSNFNATSQVCIKLLIV